MNSSRPWRRSSKNRVIAGVCGGLAEALGINPNLLRLAWVLSSLWIYSGLGVILYVLAAIFLPAADDSDAETIVIHRMDRTPRWLGIVLVVVGGYLLAGQLLPEIMRTIVHEVRRIGPPLVLIAFGMWMLLRSVGKKGE